MSLEHRSLSSNTAETRGMPRRCVVTDCRGLSLVSCEEETSILDSTTNTALIFFCHFGAEHRRRTKRRTRTRRSERHTRAGFVTVQIFSTNFPPPKADIRHGAWRSRSRHTAVAAAAVYLDTHASFAEAYRQRHRDVFFFFYIYFLICRGGAGGPAGTADSSFSQP